MSLKYLPEHANAALLALDLAQKEAAHLRYSQSTLFAQPIDLVSVQALGDRPEVAEKVEAFVSRFGRLQVALCRIKLRAMFQPPSKLALDDDIMLKEVLQGFPALTLALVFGSVARGQAHAASDLDIAVAASKPLTAPEKMRIIAALAERTGRPVDLVDLKVVSEPLLGQIVQHGRRLLGGDKAYGQLISQHLFEQADFMPYRNRVLAERRAAWIGK